MELIKNTGDNVAPRPGVHGGKNSPLSLMQPHLYRCGKTKHWRVAHFSLDK
jgi:hypothetical protein